MRRLYGITGSIDMSLRKLWEMVNDREAWRAAVHGVMGKYQTQVSNWTTKIIFKSILTFRFSNWLWLASTHPSLLGLFSSSKNPTEKLDCFWMYIEYASLKLLTRVICQDSEAFDSNSESALVFLVFRKNEKKILITLYSNFSCPGCNCQVTRCQHNQLFAMAIGIL